MQHPRQPRAPTASAEVYITYKDVPIHSAKLSPPGLTYICLRDIKVHIANRPMLFAPVNFCIAYARGHNNNKQLADDLLTRFLRDPVATEPRIGDNDDNDVIIVGQKSKDRCCLENKKKKKIRIVKLKATIKNRDMQIKGMNDVVNLYRDLLREAQKRK